MLKLGVRQCICRHTVGADTLCRGCSIEGLDIGPEFLCE
jgi:hypothetical protein